MKITRCSLVVVVLFCCNTYDGIVKLNDKVRSSSLNDNAMNDIDDDGNTSFTYKQNNELS